MKRGILLGAGSSQNSALHYKHSVTTKPPHPSPPLEKEGNVKGKVKSVAFILAGFVLPVTVPSLFGEG